MRERLRRAGHEVVGFDRNPDVSDVRTMAALVKKLRAPRVVWVMVPSGAPTRETVAKLADVLERGDLVIDGGNSRFTDDFENEKLLKEKGIGYLDCGVSGGIWGLDNGYGLMVGGTAANVKRAMPIFDALRPEGPREEGFVHAGKVGAGHYTKMVHNGIEYGLMAAYAEGYELLEAKDIVTDVPGAFKAGPAGRSCAPGFSTCGQGPRGGRAPRGRLRLHGRLGRGPLDGGGGDRQLGAHAGDLGVPVRAVRLAPGGVPDDEGCRRAARPVRRPRGHGVEEGRALRRGEAPKDVTAVRRTTRRAERPTKSAAKAASKGRAAAKAGPSSGTGETS